MYVFDKVNCFNDAIYLMEKNNHTTDAWYKRFTTDEKPHNEITSYWSPFNFAWDS